MGGNGVDPKKEQTTEPEKEVEILQKDEQELPTDIESPAQPKEDEVETVEDFDPERAERSALLDKYKKSEEQLREAEDRVLRTVAEAENFKKRLQRERDEQTRYANEAIIRELLPVIDNLERALDHSEAGSDQGSLVEGLNMTLKAFLDTMARFGCTPVEAVGQVFDPNFHEAVSQEETADYEANSVLHELQKGYTLKGRLLRPAMVVVSKMPEQSADSPQKEAEVKSSKTSTGKIEVKVIEGD